MRQNPEIRNQKSEWGKFLIALLVSGLWLLASGCGFRPVYGPAGADRAGYAVEEYLEQVDIANIPDREGQILRNALIDRFYRDGRPVSAPYALSVEQVREERAALDVTSDSDTTRTELSLRTNIQLVDKASGRVLLKRSLKAVTSYNVLGSQFTTRVAEDDARKAALNDLARQIELQLSLFFSG